MEGETRGGGAKDAVLAQPEMCTTYVWELDLCTHRVGNTPHSHCQLRDTCSNQNVPGAMGPSTQMSGANSVLRVWGSWEKELGLGLKQRLHKRSLEYFTGTADKIKKALKTLRAKR